MNKLVFVPLLANVLASGIADAIPLQDLLNGASLTAGELRFDQWQLLGAGLDVTDPAQTPDLGRIDVQGVVDDARTAGVDFDGQGEFRLQGGEFTDLYLGFRVSRLDGGALGSSFLGLCVPPAASCSTMVPGVDGDPVIFIDTFPYPNAAAVNPLDRSAGSLATASVEQTLGTLVSRDTAFFGGRSSLFSTLNLLLYGSAPGDSVEIAGFRQRFSTIESVPEPATLPLFGLGAALGGLAAGRRPARATQPVQPHSGG